MYLRHNFEFFVKICIVIVLSLVYYTQTMTTTKKGFTLYIDQVNQQRSTYSTALSWVLSYKNIDGNLISSLFVDAQNINQTTIDQTISDIQQRKDFLQSMTDDLLTDVSLNEHQKAFIQRTIEHTICAYSLLQEATRIEAQKSGMQIAPRLLNKARKNIHKYETYLYGKKISQIPEEKNKVLLHCIHMLQHNKNKIKSDEYHDFLVFLQTQYKEAIPSIVRLKSPSVPINNKHISAEQLAYIFFLVCRIFWQNTVCILYTKVKKTSHEKLFYISDSIQLSRRRYWDYFFGKKHTSTHKNHSSSTCRKHLCLKKRSA